MRRRRAATADALLPPAGRQGGGTVPGALVEALDLAFVRRAGGVLAGEHRASGVGSGTELAQLRPYQPGDDVRQLDPAATARTGIAHVRQQVPERLLTTWLAVDVSASMAFGTADRLKSDVAEGVVDVVGTPGGAPGRQGGPAHLRGPGLAAVAAAGRPRRPGRAAPRAGRGRGSRPDPGRAPGAHRPSHRAPDPDAEPGGDHLGLRRSAFRRRRAASLGPPGGSPRRAPHRSGRSRWSTRGSSRFPRWAGWPWSTPRAARAWRSTRAARSCVSRLPRPPPSDAAPWPGRCGAPAPST